MKICPECNGSGLSPVNNAVEFDIPIPIHCSTCEGEGRLPDEPALNHCPACGEPIAVDASWCQFHSGAAEL